MLVLARLDECVAVHAGTMFWTLLSILELSLLISDVILLYQFGAAVVCLCLRSLRCSFHTYSFDCLLHLSECRKAVQF